MEAAEELREAAAGTAAPKTDGVEARESGFEHERVAAHLEAAAQALDGAMVASEACAATAARLRELAGAVRGPEVEGKEPGNLADGDSSFPALATEKRRKNGARDVFGGSGTAVPDLETLERTLTVLEEKLYASLTAAAPEDLLVRLKEHAARELAPYRARMGAVQLRQVEHQFVQKQLLVHYNLPRLSLFYMSQQ
jgi:hypothetical protein